MNLIHNQFVAENVKCLRMTFLSDGVFEINVKKYITLGKGRLRAGHEGPEGGLEV